LLEKVNEHREGDFTQLVMLLIKNAKKNGIPVLLTPTTIDR
jgi:hypothetical protein